MAINLDNVKSITHNNKTVVKIEDSNGNTIWEVPTQTGTLEIPNDNSVCTYSAYDIYIPSRNTILGLIESQLGISQANVQSIDEINLSIYVQTTGGSSTATYTPKLSTSSTPSSTGSHLNSLTYTSANGGSTSYTAKIEGDVRAQSNQTTERHLYGLYWISVAPTNYYRMDTSNTIQSIATYNASTRPSKFIVKFTYI